MTDETTPVEAPVEAPEVKTTKATTKTPPVSPTVVSEEDIQKRIDAAVAEEHAKHPTNDEIDALKARVEQADKIIETAAPPVAKAISLKDFKQGQSVDVMKDGNWLVGLVTENTTWGVAVHTDRGPVTIGTTDRIRLHVNVAPADPAESQPKE